MKGAALRLLVGAAVILWPGVAWSQPAEAVRIGFDETLSGPTVISALRDARPSGAPALPLAIRLLIARSDIEPKTGVYDFTALDARLDSYERVDGLRVYLDFRVDALAAADVVDWNRLVRTTAARYRKRVFAFVFSIGRGPTGARPDPVAAAFFIKSTVVALHAGDDSVSAVLGELSNGDSDWLTALYQQDIAAYVDAVTMDAAAVASLPAVVDRHDPTSGIVLVGVSVVDDVDLGGADLVARHLQALGTRVTAVTYATSVRVAASGVTRLGFVRDLVAQPIVALDERAVSLRLTRGGADVAAAVPHRLLFGLGTSTNYVIYAGGGGAVTVSLADPTATRPLVVDAIRGTREPAVAFSYNSETTVSTFTIPADGRPMIVDWNTDRRGYTARSEVSSSTLPSLSEIIARYQQAQAAQDAGVARYIANALMEQHFRGTAADLAFDVVTENTFFVEGASTEIEERSFRLNGTLWGADRPPFPLLQAEKVLSLPLDLRLTSDYRYRFVGVETVRGREAFAIRFDPIDTTKALYRGTVWIDRATWLKLKVQAVQTEVSTPVLSSEETHYFSVVGTANGRTVTLLTELVGRQSLLIAGRNLLLERSIHFDRFEINPVDFASRRDAARASDRIMYRDTDLGIRYLVKRDGVRVVEPAPATSAKAMLLGVMYDPAYDYPLPLGGLNYLDFDFLGPNNQLAVVFGGVLALVNVQRPNLIGKSIDGSVDMFAIAVPSSDRVYDVVGERTDERLLTVPFVTGTTVGWRLANFSRLVASYQFRYDHFAAEAATAPEFRVPASTITNGAGLSLELKRAGYSVTAGWTGYRRANWTPWGEDGDYSPGDDAYAKHSIVASKTFFTGFHKISLDGGYFGGRNLDRFSKYQFGLFDDHKVRGVPAGGVRFEELSMFRGAYSFNLLDLYRLDLFFDQAFGRDRDVSPDWRPITGVGAAFNLRGPKNTLLRGEFGKSFLPAGYQKPGSIVFQFQILKPL